MKKRICTLFSLVALMSIHALMAQTDSYIQRIEGISRWDTVLGQAVEVRPNLRPTAYAMLPSGEQVVSGEMIYKSASLEEVSFFVSKFSADGAVLWTYSFPLEHPSGTSFPQEILLRSDGGFWFIVPDGVANLALIHLSGQGDQLSFQQIENIHTYRPVDVVLGPQDGIYLLRRVRQGGQEPFFSILHLNAAGSATGELAFRPSAGGHHYYLSQMAYASDGALVLSGARIDQQSSEIKSIPFAMKIDTLGTIRWSHDFVDHGSFAPVGLTSVGGDVRMVLRGFFDQVTLDLDANGTPTDVWIQETAQLDLQEHLPETNTFQGNSFLSLVAPWNFVDATDIDGQWAMSRWDEQGELEWSHIQAPFLENTEWITPTGLGTDANGAVGFAASGFWVPNPPEHKQVAFLVKFTPQAAASSTCVGSSLTWTTTPATIEHTPVPWTSFATSSPAPVPSLQILLPDSLLQITEICESNSGSQNTLAALPITVGPNPILEEIEITTELPLGEVQMYLTDINGRTVMQGTYSMEQAGTMSLDMKTMQSGMYFLTLTGPGFSWRQKLLKAE